MATAPVKSQPLHNFSLPFLKWGGTGTAKSHHAATSSHHHHHHHHRFRRPLPVHEPDSDSDARPPRVGSRPARTNRSAISTNKHHQSSPLRNNDHETDEEEKREASAVAAAEGAAAAAEEAVQKPWNLRPRKPAVPVAGGASRSGNGEAMEPGGTVNGEGAKSMRLRGMMTGEAQCSSERKEKRKFWIALSREEIEEDIFVMTGSRPARRPRKRPKNVQKQMDSVFPGLWLVGITADAYRVADTPAKR